MICYDVDTALAEVPVNAVGLTDDTDFKSLETAVAYNASGMALYWHFITSAGAYTCTAVTPTTGGTYDWAHQQQGFYTIEIPASGGASINNDTEGFGYFTGFATGVLPWRGPTLCFRAAALNDALIEGGDLLDVSVTQLGGDAQSVTDLKDFADAGYDPATNKIEGVKLADTLTTYTSNTPQTGDAFGRLGAPAGASVSADIAAKATPADVNAQVLDVLNTDTFAEPSGVPGATNTLVNKISWLYMALRNKVTVTATKKTFFDDGDAAEWEKDLSDDGTTYTESEGNSI